MAYEIYKSKLDNSPSTVKEKILERFQANIDKQFENATSIYNDCQEETVRGSLVFSEPFSVRINHIIDSLTGKKLGYDWHKIIFKDINHNIDLGNRYKYNGNTWMAINGDSFTYSSASVYVRRMNEVLKFIDRESGKLYVEPCIVEYDVNETAPKYANITNIARGDIMILCQYNDITDKIKRNQRFLINGEPYKVKQLNNMSYNNTSTDTDILVLYLDFDVIMPDDDEENSIANYNSNNYSLKINLNEYLEQNIGYQTQLSSTVLLNDIIIDSEVVWTTSNSDICTVDNDGNIHIRNYGLVDITCSMKNNPTILDVLNINVKQNIEIVNDIVILPEKFEIKSFEDPVEYTVYLYKNGIQQSDIFTFSANFTDVNKYSITSVGNNGFTLSSNGYSQTDLVITCTTGSLTKDLTIKLKDWV